MQGCLRRFFGCQWDWLLGSRGGRGFVFHKYPFWFPPGVVDEEVNIDEVKAFAGGYELSLR